MWLPNTGLKNGNWAGAAAKGEDIDITAAINAENIVVSPKGTSYPNLFPYRLIP